mgnify:FL=1
MNTCLNGLAAFWARLAWAWADQSGALTTFAVGDAATAKRWARQTWIEAVREIYFGKFMRSNDKNALIDVKEDLEGQPGDRLTFYLTRKLSGDGRSGDDTLENNEEAMNTYIQNITIDQRRNAVRTAGRMSERRTAFNQRDAAKDVLKTWMAETIDNDIFTVLDTSPTRVLYGGTSTATTDITTASGIAITDPNRIVARARKVTPKIWPVRVDNRDWYILLLHTDVGYDLSIIQRFQEAQQRARPGGDENPLFSGALGTWGGCIIHSHENVPTATTWGAAGTLTGAANFFMGRQVGCFAWGARPEWWEKEFDYGAQVGFAIGSVWGFAKSTFNAADHSFISFRTFRTNT